MPSDSDTPANEPNLELPSFGFGRKKKRAQKSAEEPADEAAPASAPERPTMPSAPSAASAPPASSVPAAPPAPPAQARVPAGPTPARPPARPAARPPARPPSTVTPPVAEPAEARPAAPRPAPARPAAAHPPAAPAAAPRPVPLPTVADTGTEPTAVDPIDAAAAALAAPRRSRPDRARARRDARAARREEKAAQKAERKAARKAAKEQGQQPDALDEPEEVRGPDPVDEVADDAETREDRRTAPAEALAARLPAVKPFYAALLTGLLSGLAAVLVAIGASRGCEAVRDTSGCGGGLGLLATVVLLAVEVLIGASLLKAWRISDPFSTSFLGVGIVAIIAMLTFLSHLDSPWMILVIPLMTAASFVLSWWVTVRFIDENPMSSEIDSERGEPDFTRKPHDEDSRA